MFFERQVATTGTGLWRKDPAGLFSGATETVCTLFLQRVFLDRVNGAGGRTVRFDEGTYERGLLQQKKVMRRTTVR